MLIGVSSPEGERERTSTNTDRDKVACEHGEVLASRGQCDLAVEAVGGDDPSDDAEGLSADDPNQRSPFVGF